MRFFFASLFVVSIGVLSAVAQGSVDVPYGKAANIDGKIDAQEWADASRHELANGVTLFLKTDGSHVYVGMRGQKQGWSHVYLNEGGSDVSVVHASAALGRIIYKQDDGKLWQPMNEFAWQVRERVVNANVMDAYLAKNGWVASNNNMGNADEVEYKLAVKSSEARIAAVFMSPGVSPAFFPATLDDDSLKQKLLEGNAIRDVKFDVAQWARLRLPSKPATAAGSWEGAVTREGKTWRVNAHIAPTSATVDFVDLGITDIAFPLFVDGSRVRLEKPQPNSRPPVIFDGSVDGNVFAGSWSGLGVTGTFSMKRTNRKSEPVREEEVTFRNGEVALSGTLLLPVKRDPKSPAVVITHGSSPNERAGYRSWARSFANAGIAALIYDKRGAGKSTGNTRAASMEDLADDAIAGLQYLKTQRTIDSAKIGVAGHSQGGWIAPLAAVRSKDVAFVIASAAAAVTPAEQSIYHRAGVMRSEGISEAEIAQATKLREKLYEMNRKILAGKPYQTDRAAISQELIANKDARWFSPAELPPQLAGDLPPDGALRLLFFDPGPVWEKLKVPVLVIWGDKDTVVPFEKSRGIIERAQAKARNQNLTTKIFPNVDHGNNLVAADGQWDFPRVNSEFDRAMTEWVISLYRRS
ncbi:MAG: alpha/beta fold hydrolase [Pyrinomonadaceae bacterium]